MKNITSQSKKLFSILSLMTVLLFTLYFLCSCEGENESSNISSENSNANESFEEYVSEPINSEESSSQDTELSIEDELSNSLNKYLLSDEFSYELKADFTLVDDVTTLCYKYGAFEGNRYSVCKIMSEESEIWKTEDYYVDGKAYLNDIYLGKSSFQCPVDIYSRYIDKNLCYFDFSSSYTNVSKEETETGTSFSYGFTYHILEEKFVDLLKSVLSIKNLEFTDGKIEIIISENNIKAFSEINTFAFFDDAEYPATIYFEITVDKLKMDFSSDFTEYKLFDSAESFTFSKVFYNLTELSAYSIFSETRIYNTKDSDKKYTDINTNFSSSFLTKSPTTSFIMETSKNVKLEKYVDGGFNYERLLTSKNNNMDFKESYIDSPISKNDTIGIWCPYIFSLLDTLSYTVTENADYYIIDYTYTSESAYSILCSYKDFYLKNLKENVIDKTELSNYTVEKSIGTLTIRKTDLIIIESSFNISINLSETQKIQIINSTEILALNEDVEIKFPDFKNK